MSNTHQRPDVLHEMQALSGDLLPACILSTTWPVVPASSLTLAAFPTYGYAISGRDLIYIDQPAVTVTLPSAAATYWLALHRDVTTPVSGWTRRVGSHYLFQASASQPAAPEGAVLLSSITVAGAVITAVSQAGIRRAPMSRQDAGAVAITGGHVHADLMAAGAGAALNASYSLVTGGPVHHQAKVGVQQAPATNVGLAVSFAKGPDFGLFLRCLDTDIGNAHVIFGNQTGALVGSITCTGSATAYNTTSDVRLKEAITPLQGALRIIQALKPIAHRWKADGSPGVGFLADEVQQVLPNGGVVTGEPGAINADGTMAPQMMDYSKLVPYLVSAVQALLTRVEVLEARRPAVPAP